MTITVNSFDVNGVVPNKQLYRIDIPIPPELTKVKLTKDLRKQVFINEKLMDNIDAFNKHFRIQPTSVNNMMFLFPAVPASTIIKFTLNEVVLYPKVVALAQFSQNVYNELLWRKGVSINTSVDDHLVETFNIEDPHHSKMVFLKRVKRKEQHQETSAMAAAIEKHKKLEEEKKRGRRKIDGEKDQREVHKIQVPGEKFASASLLVSTIPGSYDDSHGGAVFLHEVPSLASSRTKVWMILMDRTVHMYHQTTDLTPMESITLKSCTVTKNDEGIVILTRTKAPACSWYIYSNITQQNNLWYSLLSEEISSHKASKGKQVSSNSPRIGATISESPIQVIDEEDS